MSEKRETVTEQLRNGENPFQKRGAGTLSRNAAQVAEQLKSGENPFQKRSTGTNSTAQAAQTASVTTPEERRERRSQAGVGTLSKETAPVVIPGSGADYVNRLVTAGVESPALQYQKAQASRDTAGDGAALRAAAEEAAQGATKRALAGQSTQEEMSYGLYRAAVEAAAREEKAAAEQQNVKDLRQRVSELTKAYNDSGLSAQALEELEAAKQELSQAEGALTYSPAGRIGNTLAGAAGQYAGSLLNALPAAGAGLPSGLPQEVLDQSRENLAGVKDTLYGAADLLSTRGTERTETAKRGLGTLGTLAVDVGTAAAQMAGDAGLGVLTGGGMLPVMAVRSFGGGAQSARLAGAGEGMSALYGAGSAAVEVLTEKLGSFSKPLQKLMGKGVTDDLVERAIQRAASALAKTQGGQAALEALLRLGASGAGEGLEEVIAGAVDPVLQRLTYNPEATFDLEETLYEGLIGSILGLAWGSVELGGNVRSGGVRSAGQASESPLYQTALEMAGAGQKGTGLDTRVQEGTATEVQTTASPAAQTPKNTASTGEAAKWIVPFSEQEAQNLTSKKGVVNGRGMTFQQFITNAKSIGNTVRFYFGKVSDALGEKISRATGQNLNGYNIAIRSDEIIHAIAQHGNAGAEAKRGQLPVTQETLARLPEVFENPDEIIPLSKKDYAGRTAFEMRKQLDGYMVAVVGIANGRHSIEVDTVYIIDKKGSPTTVGATQNVSLNPTSETSSGQTLSSAPTIPQGTAGVNRVYAENGEAIQAVSSEEAQRRRAQVAEAAESLGRAGSQTIQGFYDPETQDSAAYFKEYVQTYNAGKKGAGVDSVKGTVLNQAQRQAAYLAGQADGTAQQRGAQFARTAGRDSGLVYDAYVENTLDRETADKVNAVAKALGVRVRFVDEGSIRDGEANAAIVGAEVLVEKGNENPVMFLLGHEWTHRLQELAPREYLAFREAIAEEIGDEAEVLREQYRGKGEDISYEKALDEAAANYAGRMIEDGGVLDEFIEKHRGDRTLLEKLREAIRAIMDKLTGAERRKAKTAEGKLSAALEAGARQAENLAMQEGAARGTMGKTRYSLKEDGQDGREGESWAETAEDFNARMGSEGKKWTERASGGYRIGGRLLDFEGTGEEQPLQAYVPAKEIQEKLKELGIESQVYLGTVEINRGGKTRRLTVEEAVTLFRDMVVINGEITTEPAETAGHEAYHMWAESEAAQTFQNVFDDNLDWGSDRVREEFAWLEEHYPENHVLEEMYADLAGMIHEGTNDEALRPMFRDYEAVKAAWKALADRQAEGADYSLKGSERAGDIARLRRENQRLREQVDYWKGQTRRTGEASTDKKAVEKEARRLIRSFGAQLDDAETAQVAEDLQSLYDYLARGHEGSDELTYTEARRRAEEIGRKLVKNAVEAEDGPYEEYGELRDYLRRTRLSLSEEDRSDIPDWGDFRKRNQGRLRIASGETNLDVVYRELSTLWPELFDERREVHPADQILHIAEVAEEISRIEMFNPYGGNMDLAAQSAANEILETFFDLPQTKKTFADRQAGKLEEAKAKGRRQVQETRERDRARLEQDRQKSRERANAAIERERNRREAQIKKLEDRWAAKDAAGRERRSAAQYRRRIARHAGELSQKLRRPSDNRNIPEGLRVPVAALLEAINLESAYTVDPETGKRSKNGGGDPVKRTAAFLELKKQYGETLASGGDLVIDPELFGDSASHVEGLFDQVISMRDVRLVDMNTEQLEIVWKTLRAVEGSITRAGKLLAGEQYKTTRALAQAIQEGTKGRLPRRRSPLKGKTLTLDLENPYTFYYHFGEGGMAVYRELRDAQDQQEVLLRQAFKAVSGAASPEQVKALERKTAEFTTERGDKLTLNTAQVMELYELSKREKALEHLTEGGVVQPAVKSRNIPRGTKAIPLSIKDIGEITGTLTEEERRIANDLQAVAAGPLADMGNRASMKAFGYKKFTGKRYWPIQTAAEGLWQTVEEGSGQTRSIKNVGFAKSTVPKARNALNLPGIFDTMAAHAGDMADYAAWLCPMEDMTRLFNYKYRNAEGKETGETVKGLLANLAGKGAEEYWTNLMEDIQNGIQARNDSAMTGLVWRSFGAFKGAAVGANLRVVIQQPTAFFRALAVLSPADMARGLAGGATKGNGWKKALRYSPTAMRKDAGGFDISNPASVKERMFGTKPGLRKLNDALSAPAGMADAVTWGKLWNACEWQTAREEPELARGGAAFYEAVNRRFTDMIDQTQVVDGVLQRSNIMRSSNAAAQQATSFMGEPLMSLNMMLRAYDSLRYEGDPKKRGKALKGLGRAATALILTSAVNAMAQSVIDGLRDDDEDKDYWERFRSAFTGLEGDEESPWDKAVAMLMNGNLADNLNMAGNVPFLKDALSLIQGYDVSRSEFEVVSDVISAGKVVTSSVSGEGKKTRAYALKELFAAGAKLFGIPASNIARDVWAIARSVAVETDNIPLQFEMEKAIYNLGYSGNSSRYYSILYRALEQEDFDSYEHIRTELMEEMGLSGTAIDSAMRSRYEKAAQAGDSLSQRARDLIASRDSYSAGEEKEEKFTAADLDAEEYSVYAQLRADSWRETENALERAAAFRAMEDEGRDKALSYAWTLTDETALAEASGGEYEITTAWVQKAEEAEAQGLEAWEYALFRTAYSMAASVKDENGETVESKQDQIRAWLEEQDYSEEQKEFLWGTVYKSEW